MKRLIGMLGACALLLVNSLALASDAGKERAEIRKASAKVLADLYKAKPSARKVVESAAGYAPARGWPSERGRTAPGRKSS